MVFTGIVQAVGRAVFDPETNKLHVQAPSPQFWEKCASGDSIAINGCCLTILHETTTDVATFFVMEESRAKTNLANLALATESSGILSSLSDAERSTAVNMERALKVGDPLGGHTVTGHIDGVVRITAVKDHEDHSRSVWIELPPDALVVHKGSIALDGISLTVAELKNGQLRVSLIPHTLAHTTLNLAKPGRLLNVEFDQTLKLVRQQTMSKQATQVEVASMEAFARKSLDEERMRRAIELGDLGRETAAPNPWVGCVITDKYGNIIGEGYHQKAGQPHAEIRAILDVRNKLSGEKRRESGDQVERNGEIGAEALESLLCEKLVGATCYTTLEPCSHWGRTGPCDQQLIKYKFGRVVVAITDPDEKVFGQGIQHLKDAGIAVDTNVLRSEAEISLRAYLKHRVTGKPWVVLKIATSLDAKIAARDGTSQWISNDLSRSDVHTRLRASSQAIIVGSTTAKTDNPSLTTREWRKHVDPSLTSQPIRVVVGKHVILGSNFLDTSKAQTIVYTTEESANKSNSDASSSSGIVFNGVALDSNGNIDFDHVLKDLAKRGVLQVLIEGGAKLASSILQQGLADQFVIYQAPLVLGAGALDWSIAPNHASSLKDATPLILSKVSTFGSDVCLEYVKETTIPHKHQ